MFIIFAVVLYIIFQVIFSYWKERLAARAWWREQTRAEKQIDRRFGM